MSISLHNHLHNIRRLQDSHKKSYNCDELYKKINDCSNFDKEELIKLYEQKCKKMDIIYTLKRMDVTYG